MAWRAHRYALVTGTVLCTLDSIDDGACRELRFGEGDGMLRLLLYRCGIRVHAYVNNCPHFSLPLNAHAGNFLLMAGARVMCAWHCAVFGLEHGRCLEGPALGLSLEPVPVSVHEDLLYIAAS